MSDKTTHLIADISASDIADSLGDEVITTHLPQKITIGGFCSLSKIQPGYMTFISNFKKDKSYDFVENALYILPEEASQTLEIMASMTVNFIFVKNPRLAFIRTLNRFFPHERAEGIHPTAIIHDSARIGRHCYIGPYCVVEKNCVIGDYAALHSAVHLYEKTHLGKNVTIYSGTVIGADGFGYQKNEHGSFEKFPHYGGVFIADNVEIGAKTCIDRGTMDDTYIGENCKIDNLIHIAHNVHMEEDCMVVALAMIGGSVKIGKRCWIGPSSSIRDGLVIGDDALIGMGANIVKNVEAGTIVAGNPARPMQKK